MSIEVMKLAIEALGLCYEGKARLNTVPDAIAALRTAISQQPDNAACKSVQKRLAAQQPATPEPVVVQHRKPVIGWKGETIGYTAWMDGKGLDGWPHRELYDHPAPSVPDDVVRDAAQEAVEELHKLNEYAIVYINDPEWTRVSDTCQKLIGSIDAAMLAAKDTK